MIFTCYICGYILLFLHYYIYVPVVWNVVSTHWASYCCWKPFISSFSFLLRNNECPACRTHCASRRSLRDDPNYDALISALYPDIDKYEEEVFKDLCFLFLFCLYLYSGVSVCTCFSVLQELAFNEEENDRNKQVFFFLLLNSVIHLCYVNLLSSSSKMPLFVLNIITATPYFFIIIKILWWKYILPFLLTGINFVVGGDRKSVV